MLNDTDAKNNIRCAPGGRSKAKPIFQIFHFLSNVKHHDIFDGVIHVSRQFHPLTCLER